MKIDSLDHLVLTVKDIEATASFYARVLGMDIVTFGGGRKALFFGAQKLTYINTEKNSNQKLNSPRPARLICALSRQFHCLKW